LEEVIEACSVRGKIDVKVTNTHVAEGHSCLLQWAQRNVLGLDEPVAPEWPRIWSLIQKRECVAVERLTNDEWRQRRWRTMDVSTGNRLPLLNERTRGRYRHSLAKDLNTRVISLEV
jgi:hypothetical protein